MATISAAGAGAYSNTGTWTGGVVPGDGDTADLNGFAVAMDSDVIPATGTLLALVSPAKAGQLTVAMGANDKTINALAITAGTIATNGFIAISGAAPTKTLTINGNITGGTATFGTGLVHASTASLVINGNVIGSSGSTGYGIQSTALGATTIIGNVTGGNGFVSHGFYRSGAGGTLTITGDVTGGGAVAMGVYLISTGAAVLNGSMIDSATAVAWGGRPPTWNPGANGYIEIGGIRYVRKTEGSTPFAGVIA